MRTNAPAERSWLALTGAHTRWVFATTWRNGEQLLLLIGIPLAAFIALTQTELLSTSTSALIITSSMIVLAAGFTSPAISIAFERRYGTYAFLGTTPQKRTSIIAGTLTATVVNALLAITVVILVTLPLGRPQQDSPAAIIVSVVLGLVAVVPWAFVLGGTARSETVLVLANGVFVLAILFGGILVPAATLPYGDLLPWLPTGAMIDMAASPSALNGGVLIGWGAAGTACAIRFFRWR